jgi:hypothetical protein
VKRRRKEGFRQKNAREYTGDRKMKKRIWDLGFEI